MAFDKKLLDVIACPVCKGKLILLHDGHSLVCRFDRLQYAIQDGIPVLIDDKAKQLSLDELEAIK
ncbi:Trm112 family protein [Alteromonas sp. ASW11-130]|uniref:Trm112 family protein n=1 Tax=Alteromonas sp. ASW11-130 TaxID=3015775 RepID=UPI002241EF1A|nr:Trm112 family protein [Alteromonas sp. ASW11-130]MCW8092158.1 Trm112 family protein [Alteromonas sp. ASW11-130]